MNKRLMLTLLYTFCWVLVLAMLTGCSGTTPIEKYKATIEKKEIKDQVKAIESVKEALAEEAGDADFLKLKQPLIADLEVKNKALQGSLKKIKIKDSQVLTLHTHMTTYAQNNEILIAKSSELFQMYADLLATKDDKAIEENYGKIVQAARGIDTLSQQTNDYKIAWEEGLITMDVKEVPEK